MHPHTRSASWLSLCLRATRARPTLAGTAVCLCLAVIAAPAAALPTPDGTPGGHPIGASAASCEISAHIRFDAAGRFSAGAERSTCAGALLSQAIDPATVSATVSGRARRNAACQWSIHHGQLTLWAGSLVRPRPGMRSRIDVSLASKQWVAGAAAPLAGNTTIHRDRVSYTGIIALAPEAQSAKTRPPCPAVTGPSYRLSVALSISSRPHHASAASMAAEPTTRVEP